MVEGRVNFTKHPEGNFILRPPPASPMMIRPLPARREMVTVVMWPGLAPSMDANDVRHTALATIQHIGFVRNGQAKGHQADWHPRVLQRLCGCARTGMMSRRL